LTASLNSPSRWAGKSRAAFLGLLALWTVGGCGSGGGKPAGSAQAGKEAPAFKLSNLAGQQVSLKDFRGKIVLLDFWATWCPPCRQSIPALQELHKEYSSKGFLVVGVSLDEDPGVVPEFVKQEGIDYPILLGGESDVSLSYEVRGIPAMYLVDKQGRVVRRWIGYDSPMKKEWRDSINALLTS
jgi:peroxiredoxin